MSEPRWLVLGAGISGLAAAQYLRNQGCNYLLIEQSPSTGGLTRTTQVADFCFDYTGHFLHLSRYPTPAAIPYAGLRDSDWMQVNRRSYFLAEGKLVTAPIQYNLGELPDVVLRECIDSYERRPTVTSAKPSFRDYIVSGFGTVVADRYLIPQNEKTMAITLDRLSTSAVKRFFPAPDEQRVRAGFSRATSQLSEYNSKFWYPKSGGIDLLVRGFRSDLKNLVTSEEVVAIDLDRRLVATKTGKRFEWDYLLSSIPLKQLCRLSGDSQLVNASESLSHSSTISFNFGVRGVLPHELSDAHWIYVPNRAVPFYRFGCYSNISTGMCSPGNSSIYVEVAVPGDKIDSINVVGELQPKVISALERLGWVASSDIVCSVVHIIRCAYVHHTAERDLIVPQINTRLASSNVFPIGRYGLWDYTGMEDSIVSAFDKVQELL